MKNYKNVTLSILLFVFSLLAFHDYLLEYLDKDTQYELCYLENDKNSLDDISKIHDVMHTICDVVVDPNHPITLTIANAKPLLLQENFTSFIGVVPQKPPLA